SNVGDIRRADVPGARPPRARRGCARPARLARGAARAVRSHAYEVPPAEGLRDSGPCELARGHRVKADAYRLAPSLKDDANLYRSFLAQAAGRTVRRKHASTGPSPSSDRRRPTSYITALPGEVFPGDLGDLLEVVALHDVEEDDRRGIVAPGVPGDWPRVRDALEL